MSFADTHISLAHGNGGRLMRTLIQEIFANTFAQLATPQDSPLNIQTDAALLSWNSPDIVITTDGFTVQPLEFPNADIGALAVHGTVNDLAVSGAVPIYLTLNVFMEEGLEIAQLRRIIHSLATAAKEVGVRLVAGDTKVVRRGEGSGLYLATTGIGRRAAQVALGFEHIQAGDKILVSGAVGNHGIAVMLAREQFGLRGDLCSDCASVLPLTQAIWDLHGVRFMRDPTRGGLATVAHEICQATQTTVRLTQKAIPILDPVQTVCDMLGYNPLYLACEGRVVAVVKAEIAEHVLQCWRALPQGRDAAMIGTITEGAARVELVTEFGGTRLLEELEDDPLPRIC